jgi:hypothetical protein
LGRSEIQEILRAKKRAQDDVPQNWFTEPSTISFKYSDL